MEKTNDTIPAESINHVTVRLPPCWRENISLWFVQAAAQFVNSCIKEDFTKYNIIIAALDSQTLQCVSDIVTHPPTTDKYSNLKAALIDRLQDSAEKRLTRLLTGIQLEDRKPTGLLRHMLELAGPTLAESAIVRTLWLQRLPLIMTYTNLLQQPTKYLMFINLLNAVPWNIAANEARRNMNQMNIPFYYNCSNRFQLFHVKSRNYV